ncbi:MAG TPA: VOC family protein [Candidatus Acidoferrum sp.]
MENMPRRTFLVFTAGAVMAPANLFAEPKIAEVPTLLDHILLGCSDLDRGIAFVEERTGVRPSFGGVHPGRGTQNALLSLGTRRYLEIIAPDPKQSTVQQYSVIRQLKKPRLIGWAAHPRDMQSLAAKLAQSGIQVEGPTPGSRQRPDGRVLRWKALRLKDDHGGLLPFFIEWSADSVHPSVDAPKGCSLVHFQAVAREPGSLAKMTALLGLDLAITKGEEPLLIATIAGREIQSTVTS